MRYHIKKIYTWAKDICKMLRLVFGGERFIICYHSKFTLNWVETDNLCIISGDVNSKPRKELAKQPQTADILCHPYKYRNETQKEYLARVRAGQLR